MLLDGTHHDVLVIY